MRKVSESVLARAPQYPRGANRYSGRASARDGGLAWAILLAVLFALIFYQNLPGSLDGMSARATYSGANVEDRIIKIGMIVISLYAIATRWSLARVLAKHINPGATAFLLLAPLSFLWSIEPSATLLRFVTLTSIVLTCYAIGLVGWHRERFQQVALPPLMFILLASLVAGMLYPDRIIEVGTDLSQLNAWHGITRAKNEFGMTSSMAAIICVNRWLAGEGRTRWAIAGTIVAFTCLLLSRSNTSLLATMVGVLSMVLVMRVPVIRQRYSTPVVISIAVTILLYELAIQDVIPGVNTLLAPVMHLTGKDTTFSARSVIWGVIKEHIQAAPILGTGYGAYWLGPDPLSPSFIFVTLMYFYPTESHNGYLEALNDLGIVGLLCVLAFVFWFIRQALQLMRIDRSQASLYLALLFQEMVVNMSESEWFSRTNTFAVLFLASVCLSRALYEARLRSQPARSTRSPVSPRLR